jgi:DNA recombination protein RmuC
MSEIVLIVILVILIVTLVMLAFLLQRVAKALPKLESLEKNQDRYERSVRDEITRNRQETAEQARGLRQEVQLSLKNSTGSLVYSVDGISKALQQRLQDFANRLNGVQLIIGGSATELRRELTASFDNFKSSQEKQLSENSAELQRHFDSFGRRLSEFSQANQDSAKQTRTDLAATLKDFKNSLQENFYTFEGRLITLTEKSETKSEELRRTVEQKLTDLQADNGSRLEEMRRTVDEKLQGTLDRRLGESFKLVNDSLEQVHKGLGEMQTLAIGVGDLKRVLTNVKTRGTWSEMQLANLLEQILTPDQYGINVQTKPTGQETVEFAIKLPGREDNGKVVWLPIDAKFPKEDYERLVDAAEHGDTEGIEQAAKSLEARVRSQARDIRDKYIEPPHTTDFGLLYLPVEGLYAEVLRRPGLADSIQRQYRVVIAGPTTLAALLNSLQMGFQTLAIQKRSSEVWRVLGAVKTDFGKFGDMLEKVKKKLEESTSTIEDAANRSRQLEKKLKKVETLPVAEVANLADVQSGDEEATNEISEIRIQN